MKIFGYILLALVAIVLVVVAVPVSKVVMDSSNPLRKPEAEIRESILELTPIGASMEDVLKAIESNENWETTNVNYERGVLLQELGKPGDPVGKKSIRVFMGKYTGTLWYDKSSILNTIFYTLTDVYVSAFWAFDENENLIEIFVLSDRSSL